MVGTFTQMFRAPVEETYDSTSNLSGVVVQFADEVANVRSHGSWLPLGAVQRFCTSPFPPPVEDDSSQGYVPEKSIGKLESVPEATEVVEVTVMMR